MKFHEVNFDGLVGPSHHYAGLSKGNIASIKNAKGIANPKAAALQGLEKMRAMSELGLKQAVLPPHLRPNTTFLRSLGFSGSNHQVIENAWKSAPDIAAKCFSASPMWTANAATVSPSPDCLDGKTHFTAANLCRMLHRSYESDFTSKTLKTIFSNESYFKHHEALPAGLYFGDEGAANHTRFAKHHGAQGLEFFVFGEESLKSNSSRPTKYPARQSLEASEAIARLHGLDSGQTVFAQQNPDVIDSGVFHNDVIAVGSTDFLFFHELAFANTSQVLEDLQSKFVGGEFKYLEVKNDQIDLQTAIDTYLFNTQLIDISDSDEISNFILIAPSECKNNTKVSAYLDAVVKSSSPINKVHYFDLRESMKNGGGPACLRLRVVLSDEQIDSIKPRVFFNDQLHSELSTWVNRYYRDRLTFDCLQDPQLIDELDDAMRALEPILGLTGLYE